MSEIFTLTNRSSILSVDFSNPIRLNHEYEYGLALIGFHSYNTIPNIGEGVKFYYSNNNNKPSEIPIPSGAYEITDISDYLNNKLNVSGEDQFFLRPNSNTLKCEIFHRDYDIDFRAANSLGKLLGFSPRILKAGQIHESDLPVNIVKVRTIRVDCNITAGAYYNEKPAHTLYEFPIAVDPGFAIDERPQNLLYLPVNRREISNITLKILDQDSDLINFRGEEIIVRLELKRWS